MCGHKSTTELRIYRFAEADDVDEVICVDVVLKFTEVEVAGTGVVVKFLLGQAGFGAEVHEQAQVHIEHPADAERRRLPCTASDVEN